MNEQLILDTAKEFMTDSEFTRSHDISVSLMDFEGHRENPIPTDDKTILVYAENKKNSTKSIAWHIRDFSNLSAREIGLMAASSLMTLFAEREMTAMVRTS